MNHFTCERKCSQSQQHPTLPTQVISLHCIVHYIKASFLFPISCVCLCICAPNSPLKYHYFEKWYDKVHQTPKILFCHILCVVYRIGRGRQNFVHIFTKFRLCLYASVIKVHNAVVHQCQLGVLNPFLLEYRTSLYMHHIDPVHTCTVQ